MPLLCTDLLPVSLRQCSFRPAFAELHGSFCRKLMVSLTLASIAVFGGMATAADMDMDGIQDRVDIDDDNDGILDSVEGTLVPPTGPVASTTNYTFTPAGNPGNIGDTSLYPNAGTFNGTSFDLRLTVVANSDPANLIVDISGFAQAGITYPILLGGTPTTGTANINFEFLISGTTTPMQVPSIYTWIDLDTNEKLTVASNELSEYQLGNPTDITVSSAGGNTTFASNITGGPIDEKRWIRTTMLSNSNFTFQYDKRIGDTGYRWNISTYTNGATPIVLNAESFYAGDMDGDGISNSRDLDSDNDGISDLVESGTHQSNIAIDADSSGSISSAEANSAMGAGLGDVDGDGLVDLFDADTGSQNDLLSVGTTPVNTDGDAQPNYLDLDSEADGIPDMVEALATAGYVANDGNVADQDTDSDGVIDLFDANDGSTNDFGGTFTQPEDTDIDGTPDYLDTDSDADTLNDNAEIVAAFTPTYADPDGSVSVTLVSLQNTDSDTADVDFRSLNDADGDGIPDSTDLNVSDPCIPNSGGIPTTKDCDGDGNPVATDPDAGKPNASNDSGAAGATINLLANDDHLANNDPDNLGTTSITAVSTGTTCAGTPTFDAATGNLVYASAANETSGTCDLVYEVCNTATAASSFAICSTATVTISVADADGDGIPDDIDTDPADVCIPNTSGLPASKDCDGDGNPASTDPDPAAPNASHDAGAAGNPVNILVNDDYLPNNDPNVIGNTSITQMGGSCIGSVSLDANTGIAIFTPGAGDTTANCTVEYKVCSASPANTLTCENATITFAIPEATVVPDTDGDGLTDDVDSAPADACVPDVGGTPGYKDCDGDGNPAVSDPDSAKPQATDDTGSSGVAIDILANDNYLPNNNPGNTGKTTLAHIGGTCTGNVALDANTGTATYTTGVGEAGTSCTINYRVCNDSSAAPVCRTAELIISNSGNANPQPNSLPSTDNDGDGIPNSIEGSGDTDGDGVPDYLDLDSDNDGLLDSIEMTEDRDMDGATDYLDLDSDNDGLTDTFEAGGADANGNGIVDAFIDTNNDGWADSVAASPLPEPDFDGDGFVDYLDLDSENDGLPDIRESMGSDWDSDNNGMIDNPVDANGDGLADNIVANEVSDSDEDGAYDHLDLDSNNDGMFDLVSAGGTDANGDGRVDTWQDDDNDGIPNSVDVDITGGVDADNDGIDDSADASFVNIPDSDGDGIVDTFDADLQGDGFAPIQFDASSGDIRIGLHGGGCTIATNNASADTLLPLLVLLSMLWLKLRRSTTRKQMQCKGLTQKLTFLIVTSCVLSSCSMGSMERSQPYGNRTSDRATNTPVVAAARPDTKFRRHVYAGTGIGASWLEPDTSEVAGVDVNDRVNAGGQVTLGVDLTRRFSLELHSADLGSAGLSPSGRINYHMHGGSALVYFGKNRLQHARRGLTGFGRLGYGTLDDSSVGDLNYIEDNNTHILFGGGLEYATRSGLGLRAELISFDADAKYGQLGLVYRMGGKHRRAPATIVKAPPPAPAPAPVIVEQPAAPPPIPAVQVALPEDPCAHFTGVLEGVNFHTGSDRLTSQAEIILDGIANELAMCPATPVAISAHTDDQGSEQYNKGLSKRRALSVARHLSGRGVSTSRMSARAFGESRPIAPNTTSEGRASNRRVELVAQ